MRKILFICLFATSLAASAQILKPAKWTFTPSKTSAKVGETIDLVFTAKIDDSWYMYSSELKVDGPLPTTANFTKNDTYTLVGKLVPVKPKEKYDDIWGGKVQYFEHEAKFIQKVKITKANPVIEGKIECQTCTTKDGKCVPNKDKFKFEVKTI
ncbi:protein-disulfide reductase DsbD domain-containing protein [Emticicia sp. 17c]|uniref:protein-disulfide reductase DsbD domain-containing protein n=1 Tax=Emticicia sp. 17c TaxID=3127704 RepID=UPI00301C566B